MRILHIVVHASKITIIFFLGNKNHGISFPYILVIVCASITSNAIIFKRIADMSLLIDFCNDYRKYLCWQVSSILFSIIQVLMSLCLSLSFLGAKKKSISPATMCPAFWQNWTAYLSHEKKKIDLHNLLDSNCSSITKILQSIIIYSIVHVGCLAYHPWRNFHSGRTAWNTKEM